MTTTHECAICLSGCTKGTIAYLRPCNHAFHHDCIKTWLNQKSTCPMCRAAACLSSKTVKKRTHKMIVLEAIELDKYGILLSTKPTKYRYKMLYQRMGLNFPDNFTKVTPEIVDTVLAVYMSMHRNFRPPV